MVNTEYLNMLLRMVLIKMNNNKVLVELVVPILDEKYNRESYKKIIETAIECDVPLEINLLGIREHRHYPHDWFFEM